VTFEINHDHEKLFKNQEIASATVMIKSCTPNRITFKVRTNNNNAIYTKPYMGVLLEKEK